MLRWPTAWITGASQGIGRALSLELARQGYRVFASARDSEDLRQLAALSPNIRLMPLDVSDAEAVAQAVATIEQHGDAIDLAILNAGIYRPVPGGLAEPDVFRRHMEINYLGVVHCVCALAPSMLARRQGQIAIMGSVAGYRGLPKAAAYGPSKAALINLAETLRLEFAGSGLDLRLISPGFVATRLTAQNDFQMPFLLSPEKAARRILRGLESRRFEIGFPWLFVAWMKLLRLLPYRLYLALAGRLVRP